MQNYILSIAFLFLLLSLKAQSNLPATAPSTGSGQAGIQSTETKIGKSCSPLSGIPDYQFTINPRGVKNPNPSSKVGPLKKHKNQLKHSPNYKPDSINKANKDKNFAPGTTAAPPNESKSFAININRNFGAYDDDLYYPNDNHLAISNSGYVVSVSNSIFSVYSENGAQLSAVSLSAFFGNDPNFTGFLFDPRVIYDAPNDRFILVCLDGSQSSSNKVVVAFSQTGDPTALWQYYWYSGGNFVSNAWFDFPSIGINNNYLCVTGNLFYDAGGYAGSVVLRFNKSVGYNSGSLTYTYWLDPSDDQGSKAFTMVPITEGSGTAYGPDLLLVSTFSASGSKYQFWRINDATSVINGYSVSSYSYEIGGDASQLGSGNLLDVGDCRVQSAFYLYDPANASGHIHFCYTSQYSGSGLHNGAVRAEITWHSNGSLTSNAVAFGAAGGDYAYPNIASFGSSGFDDNVLVGANFVSPSFFPTYGVFSCDNNFQFSGSLATQFGQNSIYDYDSNKGKSRWGDYTGMQRKYGTGLPVVWVASSYGKANNTAGTWIAEVAGNPQNSVIKTEKSEVLVYPNPIVNFFELEFSIPELSEVKIVLYDASGRLVAPLYQDKMSAGKKKMNFNRAQLSTGLYLLSIEVDGEPLVTEKILVE